MAIENLPTTREPLKDVAARASKMMADSARGPLIVARDIMAVANSWADYQADADGASCDAWLKATFGRGHGLAFFDRRNRAVEVLGEDVRRWLHHDAAVWLLQKLPVTSIVAVKKRLYNEHVAQKRVVLSLAQTRTIALEMIGRQHVRAKRCATCAKLQARIAELESIASR